MTQRYCQCGNPIKKFWRMCRACANEHKVLGRIRARQKMSPEQRYAKNKEYQERHLAKVSTGGIVLDTSYALVFVPPRCDYQVGAVFSQLDFNYTLDAGYFIVGMIFRHKHKYWQIVRDRNNLKLRQVSAPELDKVDCTHHDPKRCEDGIGIPLCRIPAKRRRMQAREMIESA